MYERNPIKNCVTWTDEAERKTYSRMKTSKDLRKKLLKGIFFVLAVSASLYLYYCLYLMRLFGNSSVWRTASEDPAAEISWHQAQLNEVIKLAQSGQLESKDYNSHIKTLPWRYRHLSDDGEIVVEGANHHLKIFFFTFHGMMSGSTGYIYTADGEPDIETFDIIREKKVNAHWYQVTVD